MKIIYYRFNVKITYGDTTLSEDYIEAVKRDGVTNDDLELWWGFSEKQRNQIIEEDNLYRSSAFIELRTNKGLSLKETQKKLWVAFPLYGDPRNEDIQKGKDKPLPFELKDRINRYTEKLALNGGIGQFVNDLKRETSYNAFIRKLVKEQKI